MLTCSIKFFLKSALISLLVSVDNAGQGDILPSLLIANLVMPASHD